MLNLYKNKIKKEGIFFLFFVGFIFSFFYNISFVEAIQAEIDWPEALGVKIEEGGQLIATLPELVNYIFRFFLMIGGLAAFFMLVFGGFRYLTSAGNPAAQKDARDIIQSAILGLLLLLASYLLIQVINPDILILKPLTF